MILSSASPVSVVLGIATVAAYALQAAAASRKPLKYAQGTLLVAWLLHGLALAWGMLGGSPRFGFAPALSITAWLMLTMYLVEQQLYPRMRAASLLAVMGAVAVLSAVFFPGTSLANGPSVWLPLHLTLGVASYGLFAAAVVHAGLMTRAERRIRRASEDGAGVPLLTLERIMFHCVNAGFVLLTATLLVGWLFGEALYGHPWRFDHKTVFSLLAWVVFAVLLVGRARFGWRGLHATRMVYAGAVMLLLGYAGSRFVLEVLLGHGA